MAVQMTSSSQGTGLIHNPGYVLRKDAAWAFDRACYTFGKQVLITGAWRSYATQVRIFKERYAPGAFSPFNDYRTWHTYNGGDGRVWGRMNGAAAAEPGTSNHGSGLSVDVKTRREDGDPEYDEAVIFGSFSDPDRLEFLRVAREHGWDDDEGRDVNELWHLTYYPERDQHRGERPRPPRTFHRRVTTRATHVYANPGKGMGRLLPKGQSFTVWDGSAKRHYLTWYIETTSGNWVRSLSTKKI